MAVTLIELKQRLLERYDPDVIVELLDISSEELVGAFADKIEDRYDLLLDELYTDEEEDGEEV